MPILNWCWPTTLLKLSSIVQIGFALKYGDVPIEKLISSFCPLPEIEHVVRIAGVRALRAVGKRMVLVQREKSGRIQARIVLASSATFQDLVRTKIPRPSVPILGDRGFVHESWRDRPDCGSG